MGINRIEELLAFVCASSLLALAISTLTLAALLVLWPFGVTPTTHTLLWQVAMISCLAACAGVLLPYGLSQVLRRLFHRSK